MQVQTEKQYVDRRELDEAVQKIINHIPQGTYLAERGVLEIGPHSWHYINKEAQAQAQQTSHHAHQHTDREIQIPETGREIEIPEIGLHTRSDINNDSKRKISVMAETDPGPSLSVTTDRTSKWVSTRNREPSISPSREPRTPVNTSIDSIRYNIPEHLPAPKYETHHRIPGFLYQPAANPHVLTEFGFAKDMERRFRLIDSRQDEAAGSSTTDAVIVPDSIEVPQSTEPSVRNLSPAPSARPTTSSRPTSPVAITTTPTTIHQEQSLTNLRAEISAWQTHDYGVPSDLASRLRLKKQKPRHNGLPTPLFKPSWVRKKQRRLEHLCHQRITFQAYNMIEVYGVKETWQYDILVCWLHGNMHIWTRQLRWPPGYVDLDLDNKEEEEDKEEKERAEGEDQLSVYTFASDTSY